MYLLEEFFMNAFPAIQTLFLDGWIIQISKGYTLRANCVYPTYTSTIDLKDKISICESIYQNQSLPPAFRICNSNHDKIDVILQSQNYIIKNKTLVLSKQIQISKTLEDIYPQFDFIVYASQNKKWIDTYYQLYETDINVKDEFHEQFTHNNPERVFTLLRKKEEFIACAMLVFDRNWMGIYDVAVSKYLRRQGIAAQYMDILLSFGKSKHADRAYLSVMETNEPAIHLYQSLGFSLEYTYHYRTLQNLTN